MSLPSLPAVHIISSNERWDIIYRAGKLAYEGHGGPNWGRAIALTGCATHQMYLTGDNEDFQIDNLFYAPPQLLADMIKRMENAGHSSTFELVEPRSSD